MTTAKAWVAAIVSGFGAGLAALAVVLVGDTTLYEVTQAQWLAVGIAVFSAATSAGGLTWATTNNPAGAVAPAPVDADAVVAAIGRRLA